jgi:hypothetical protein
MAAPKVVDYEAIPTSSIGHRGLELLPLPAQSAAACPIGIVGATIG